MEFVFFWLVFAIIVGIAASSRGRSGFGWFLLAVFLSPLIAGFLVLALPRAVAADQREVANVARMVHPTGMKVCPDCAEEVQANAKICRYCRHEFTESQTVLSSREYKGVAYEEHINGEVRATIRGELVSFPSFDAFRGKIDRYRS